MSRITVVGSYIVALVMDMDRLPVEGETVTGRNFHTTHGGKGSNMAAAAARLGAEVHFVGKIGHDSHGRAFLDLLKQEGIGAGGVMTTETSPTATGIIFFTERGTNAIVIDRGANGELMPDDIARQRGLIGVGDVVLSPLEISLATARAAAERARQQGGKAILNPAPAQDLRDEDLSAFYALTPNETEARVCLGLAPDDNTPDEVLANRLLDLGAPNVIITLGAQGALWASAAGQRRVPALRVNAIDMVGAGDAFNAGLAVGLSEKRPLLDAICLGVTAASLSTEKRETIASYPYRAEVEARMGEVLAATERRHSA
jgi:ribokinase